jgi:hypothetical protein
MADMTREYPATIRNDRLRLEVKGLVRQDREPEAWAILKQASANRGEWIASKFESASTTARAGFLDWKVEQQAALRTVYERAFYDVQERLLSTDPAKFHAYAHQAALAKRLQALAQDETDFLRASLRYAADYGQHAFFDPMLSIGATRSIGITGPASALWGQVNERAVRVVLGTNYDGLPLSRRIWQHAENARKGIQNALALGVSQGRSVNEILRTVKPFMVDMPANFTGSDKHTDRAKELARQRKEEALKAADYRTRAADASPAARDALLDKALDAEKRAEALAREMKRQQAFAAAADKVPQKGLYQSWQGNAWRMVREETNRAYREAYMGAAKEHSKLVKMRWTLSAGHSVPDICDDYALRDTGNGPGVYEVGDYPALPHIGCLCYPTPEVQWSEVGRPDNEPGNAALADEEEAA